MKQVRVSEPSTAVGIASADTAVSNGFQGYPFIEWSDIDSESKAMYEVTHRLPYALAHTTDLREYLRKIVKEWMGREVTITHVVWDARLKIEQRVKDEQEAIEKQFKNTSIRPASPNHLMAMVSEVDAIKRWYNPNRNAPVKKFREPVNAFTCLGFNGTPARPGEMIQYITIEDSAEHHVTQAASGLTYLEYTARVVSRS